jgi:hypothetical protein
VDPKRDSTVRIDARASEYRRHELHTEPGAAAIDAGRNRAPHIATNTPPDAHTSDIALSVTACSTGLPTDVTHVR